MATTAGGHRKTSDWYWYQGQRDSALCTHDSFTTQQVPHLYWCGICVSSSTPHSTEIVGIGDRTCRDENGSRDSVRRDFAEGIPQRCIQKGGTLDPNMKREQLNLLSSLSERGDLNPGPPEPHSGALPGCATLRCPLQPYIMRYLVKCNGP